MKQLPVIRLKGIKPGSHSKQPLGWHTGIRCPRCQEREIIYNGNYFCAGFGDWGDPRPAKCEWALPHEEDGTSGPHYRDLEKALIKSQKNRS